jgi:hypothetical protein
MPRIARVAPGGLVYHVLNRANGRLGPFKKDDDFLAFEEVLALAHERPPIRILDWVMMSNRWSRRAGSTLARAGRGTDRLSPLADAHPRPAMEGAKVTSTLEGAKVISTLYIKRSQRWMSPLRFTCGVRSQI